MYTILNGIEKVLRGLRAVAKLSYYKLKYGGRLKVGRGVHFRKGFIINMSKKGQLNIGDGTFFNNYCSINCHDKITIGKNNLFGEGVKIYDHNHVFNDKSINMKKSYRCRSVVIGDENWFGSDVIVLSGAKIGKRNVFGANMVVDSEFGSEQLVVMSNEKNIQEICYRGERS